MRIVPSLLAETFEDFVARLRQAESFTDYVQLDMMDGVFVDSKSFPPEKIQAVDTTLMIEAHIMVANPLDYMKKIENRAITKVIFHCESEGDHAAVVEELRRRGLVAGMAIKPGTEIREFREMAHEVNTLLFLTVDPGRYGSPFRPEVAAKIAETRQIFPDKVIGVDGGVSLDNLRMFYTMGVDYVCVGSRIFLHGRPGDNYRLFLERVSGFEESAR